MKRAITMSLATLLIGFACTAAAFAQGTQSLGDYARSLKKSTNAPAPAAQKVYDNDNMPTTASVSVVGNSSGNTDAANTGDAKNADAPSAPGDKKDEPQIKAGQPVDERKQAVDAWKQKLDDQNEKDAAKAKLSDLQEEARKAGAPTSVADQN